MLNSDSESLQKLSELLKKVSGIPLGQVSESSRFVEDLGLDSLEMMELLFEAEETFSCPIEIPTEQLVNIVTVGDLLEVLKSEANTNE
jgi:acyl carrier protein